MTNSGDYNSGRRNSGNYNSGSYNSGYYNSGEYNSGNFNSGDDNSGHFNSGDYNSGDYNSGNRNSGHFNTNEPTVRMFNKDTGLKRSEIYIPNLDLPINEYEDDKLITRTYKEAWEIAWNGLAQEDKDRFLNLPNFDADIFEEITGIKTNNDKTCVDKIIEIDGETYKLIKV